MKKLLILTTLVLLGITAATVLAMPNKEPVDKITFIHYRDGRIRATGTGGPSACYKLMGIKWKSLPISYVINSGSYDVNFVTGAISAATSEWDSHTTASLFDSYAIDTSAKWDSSSPDGINAYVFGPYSNNGVIAVTNVWYTRYSKQIVDYDVLFNTYYAWKDCSTSDCSAAMDLQNIATHETGHGLGLADIYQSSCSAVTMYGYSSYGETQKRTLGQPDITGLQKIYGA